jgi:thiamine biosynthesis lipoprotein
MKKGWPLWLAGTVGVLVPGMVAAHDRDNVYCFQANVLGTLAEFVVTAPNRERAHLATGAALAEIARLDCILSGYRLDSELSRLNRAREMRVSPDLFAVLSQAEELQARSGGAFSTRMGAVEALWRAADTSPPDAVALRRAIKSAEQKPHLDHANRIVGRPEGLVFSVDALAKGYIVDRALDAARRTAVPSGILVDIGGDLRCHGRAGRQLSWQVGLADARLPYANAPIVSQVQLRDQAIATSGRGVRDRIIGGTAHGTTLSPQSGMPVTAHLSASVVAPTAAQADSLATALLVMSPEQGLRLAEQSGAQARITQSDGAVLTTTGWAHLEAGPLPQPLGGNAGLISVADNDRLSLRPSGWVSDWALQVYYEAFIDPGHRASDYRSPYLVMWISDKAGRPVRTLIIIGKDPEYQQDNHIWWALYGSRARRMVEVRSGPTSLSGRYPTFWPGFDDGYSTVAPGEYLLNIETSRERGGHTFRSIPVTIGRKAFEHDIKPTADMGTVKLVFGRQP